MNHKFRFSTSRNPTYADWLLVIVRSTEVSDLRCTYVYMYVCMYYNHGRSTNSVAITAQVTLVDPETHMTQGQGSQLVLY